MKFIAVACLIASVAAKPYVVYNTRSVSAQVGNANCAEKAYSRIRSQRYTEPLTPGEYMFQADVTQTLQIREKCDRATSTVQSAVYIAGSALLGKEITVEGCDVFAKTETIKGMFSVEEDGAVNFTLDTRGGSCAIATVQWDNISVTRCADRIAKIERQLERSMAELTRASRAFEGADDETAAVLKQQVKEARTNVRDLQQEMQYAITCEA